MYTNLEQRLLEKLRQLSPEEVLQVEEFVNFLHCKNTTPETTLAVAKSEGVFQKIWDNPDDAEYDKL